MKKKRIKKGEKVERKKKGTTYKGWRCIKILAATTNASGTPKLNQAKNIWFGVCDHN